MRCRRRRGRVGLLVFVAHSAPAAAERGRSAAGGRAVSDLKFLGVCLVIAGVVLGVAIVYHGRGGPVGRYQLQPSNAPGIIWVIDTTTGEVKTR